ncbi:hypothetical protein [Mangrovibacterium diazotrophicum]|uniref:hypothetical protein n=1 Tax=Mangrovibacterium diazotrophicum TaxID=1261403 RepID=UPI000E76E662|nr:hypothetical protein [Mangrovibacterium diazotrophicum]
MKKDYLSPHYKRIINSKNDVNLPEQHPEGKGELNSSNPQTGHAIQAPAIQSKTSKTQGKVRLNSLNSALPLLSLAVKLRFFTSRTNALIFVSGDSF